MNTENGGERNPPESIQEWASAVVSFATQDAPANSAPLLLALSPQLIALIAAPPDAAPALAPSAPVDQRPGTQTPAHSRTMELLLDVDLPVSISFGKARLPMRDVLKLTTGSIVELNRGLK